MIGKQLNFRLVAQVFHQPAPSTTVNCYQDSPLGVATCRSQDIDQDRPVRLVPGLPCLRAAHPKACSAHTITQSIQSAPVHIIRTPGEPHQQALEAVDQANNEPTHLHELAVAR